MLIDTLFDSPVAHHLIIAPHHDDEMIGCYQLMQRGTNWTVMHLKDDATRLEESKSAACNLGTWRVPSSFTSYPDTYTFPAMLKNHINDSQLMNRESGKGIPLERYMIVWFPDPDFETHPEHKWAGTVGRMLAREYADKEKSVLFGFYSVNMQAPYVRVLKPLDIQRKQNACAYFLSQKGYFDSHGEACIFEGRYLV